MLCLNAVSKSWFARLQERNNADEGISKRHKFPLLNFRTISSITQLMPFFKTLCCAFTTKRSEAQNSHTSASLPVDYVGGNSMKILQQLEESVECDFLENMESQAACQTLTWLSSQKKKGKHYCDSSFFSHFETTFEVFFLLLWDVLQ